MPDSEGAHIARLEERVQGVREDLASIVSEQQAMRKRLHDVEGVTAAFLDIQKKARQGEAEQYRRLEVRIQVLTVIVGLAAVLAPVVVAVLAGGR